MVSSQWWTSTTAPCWRTSLCPPPIATASTSTAPCSALWAHSPYSCLTPSGTRGISTPSVSSVWLLQLFPSWAFSQCLDCYSVVSRRKSVQDRMRHRHSKSKDFLNIWKFSITLVDVFFGLCCSFSSQSHSFVFFCSVAGWVLAKLHLPTQKTLSPSDSTSSSFPNTGTSCGLCQWTSFRYGINHIGCATNASRDKVGRHSHCFRKSL